MKISAVLAEQLGRMVQRTAARHGGKAIKWLKGTVGPIFVHAAHQATRAG
jgi:hypothetical protein